MIMMMIGLKITDQYVSFIYFNCGIKEINTEKIIPRELNMQLMQLRKRKPEKSQACRDSNPASCWEVSFETTHKRSARQIPLSLKPTESLLCHGSLSITLKISKPKSHWIQSINSWYLQPYWPLQHTSVQTKPQRYIRLHHWHMSYFFQGDWGK